MSSILWGKEVNQFAYIRVTPEAKFGNDPSGETPYRKRILRVLRLFVVPYETWIPTYELYIKPKVIRELEKSENWKNDIDLLLINLMLSNAGTSISNWIP